MFCLSLPSIAQVADTTRNQVEEDIERALEGFDDEESDLNPEDLAQFLQDLAANPLNLNTARLDQLALIPGMNLRLARAVIDYRRNKPFESVEELTQVRGIGPATVERMRPYVSVGRASDILVDLITSPGYWFDNSRVEVLSRMQTVLEEQSGYINRDDTTRTTYAGNQIRYYQRANYRSRRLSVNVTQLKAPGEQVNNPLEFEHTSFHFALLNNGPLNTFVVGDYGLFFGQGLVLWTGLAFGKGRETIRAAYRNERGLRPFQSSDRYLHNRGAGATVTLADQFQLTGFVSRRELRATVVSGDTINFPTATMFARTPSEIERGNNTGMEMYGGRFAWQFDYGVLGATGYVAEFDDYVLPRTAASNVHDFEGRTASVVGVDYRLILGDLLVFGEGARSQNGGMGLISGFEYPLGPNTDASVAYRNYGRDFQSNFGSGFGEVSGNPQNEEGLYLGLRHRLNNRIVLSGYFDQFRFPAPRFGTNSETTGYDWLALMEYRQSRELEFYVLVRNKVRGNDYRVTDEFGREFFTVGDEVRGSIRAQVDFWVHPQLRLRTRAEWLRAQAINADPEIGMLAFQDVRYVATSNVQIDARLTAFETESFTSRVFQFENDLLYVLSNPALFGRGSRGYILVRYQPTDFIDIWAKYGITIFENRQTVGSGLDESIGNTRSNLGLQARISF